MFKAGNMIKLNSLQCTPYAVPPMLLTMFFIYTILDFPSFLNTMLTKENIIHQRPFKQFISVTIFIPQFFNDYWQTECQNFGQTIKQSSMPFTIQKL